MMVTVLLIGTVAVEVTMANNDNCDVDNYINNKNHINDDDIDNDNTDNDNTDDTNDSHVKS